ADRRRPARAARLDRLEGSAPARALTASASPPGAGAPLRALTAGRARSRRHQEARPLLDAREADPRPTGRQPQPARRLAIPPHRDRRLQPARLRRAARERIADRLRGLPPPRRLLAQRARDHSRTRALGQRQRLPLPPVARNLRRARSRPPLHPPAAPADQRQGGSADQDAPARMVLPLRLPLQRPPRPRPGRLPSLVQPTPTTQLARRQAADQPPLTGLWVPQLDEGGDAADVSNDPAACDLRRVGNHRVEVLVGDPLGDELRRL